MKVRFWIAGLAMVAAVLGIALPSRAEFHFCAAPVDVNCYIVSGDRLVHCDAYVNASYYYGSPALCLRSPVPIPWPQAAS